MAGSTKKRGPPVAPPPFWKGRLPRLGLGSLAPVGRSRVPSRRPTLRQGERAPSRPADQQATVGRRDGGATSGNPRSLVEP
ncbi:MAG TPA: hypothetical protein VH599_00645 [Ktedonobacterales bacterium]